LTVDTEVDHGPLLKQTPHNLQPTTYYKVVEKDLAEIGAKLLIETLPKYISGKIKAKDQNHDQATFTKMFSRDDSRINWSSPAQEIYNQIRALNPEPGTWTTWKNKTLNIFKVEILNKEPSTPGSVEKIEGNIDVATKKCYLILKSIQLEGGKEMDAKSFVNGHPDFLNSKLE